VYLRAPSDLSGDGTTLIEVVMALGLVAIFLGSLFTMNSASMQTIKMARDTAAASQVLQQRVESLRIANWHQVTDADWLQANVLNSAAPGIEGLKSFSETLTLSPYDSTAVATTQLTRTGNSVRTVVRNDALLNERAVKVVWSISYVGSPNDRATTRQTVAILAKGGVAK
jgi:type II secretory pathway pseudopilin PulG